ncbi:MAG TPA: MarR family transcriptional regulator [Acidimicrobiales bacterium]|nr:MarR family transcriptional regulator [Acidimicrobiales bacterium]
MAPRLHLDPIDEAVRQWNDHGWDDASKGMAVVTSVYRVQQIFAAQINEVLQPFDLTFARYEVLALLSFSRHGMLPIGKVGERLQVHATSVTNAVDRLERQGFVERRPHPSDRRAILAVITRKGRAVVKAATQPLNEVFAKLELSDSEATMLFDLLRKLRRAAGDFP